MIEQMLHAGLTGPSVLGVLVTGALVVFMPFLSLILVSLAIFRESEDGWGIRDRLFLVGGAALLVIIASMLVVLLAYWARFTESMF